VISHQRSAKHKKVKKSKKKKRKKAGEEEVYADELSLWFGSPPPPPRSFSRDPEVWEVVKSFFFEKSLATRAPQNPD